MSERVRDREPKFTKKDLEIMRSWTLERKIQVTQTRLIEWKARFNGKIYISFSGGKDSRDRINLAVFSVFQWNSRIHICYRAYGYSIGNFCI